MALTTAQKKIVQSTMRAVVARSLERQLVAAARDVLLAGRMVKADSPADLPWADEKDVFPTNKRAVEENPLEREFMKEGNRPVRQNDSAGLTNKMSDGAKDLDHAMKWLVGYFKALKPAIDRFTRKMIKFDVSNMNKSHLTRLTLLVDSVLKLVEVLDSAGATASDITELLQSIEKELKYRPTEKVNRWW